MVERWLQLCTSLGGTFMTFALLIVEHVFGVLQCFAQLEVTLFSCQSS